MTTLKRLSLLAVLIAIWPCSLIVAQQANSTRTIDRNLQLTPTTASAERTTVIVAPGSGRQSYNIFYIDTRAFADGGVLDIDIQIAPDSGTDGSFDLFPGNVRIPAQGRPDGTLAGRYDVRRGTSTRLEYRFAQGQVFAFNLTGNWGSAQGAKGRVQFRANVLGQAVPSSPGEHTIRLSPASPSADRTATIVAPGSGNHGYNAFYIDTRDFPSGGVLDIQIQIDPNSSTDGSFDLFPGNMTPELLAHPGNRTLGGRYDIRRGSSTSLVYRFQPGQLFIFGLEGNWGNQRGATGSVSFRTSVHP
jgi:flagellar basal body L-ring protein FlgH